MPSLTLAQARVEAARLQPTAADLCASMQALCEAFNVDVDTLPEAMLNGTMRPTDEFYMHLVLESAKEAAEEFQERVERAANVSAESVDAVWRRLQRSQQHSDDDGDVGSGR